MRFLELIEAKKRGLAHSGVELRAFVRALVAGEVPDYQIAAWLMAVRWQGLNLAETEDLTWAMAQSGETLDLEGLPRPWLDKHSTGGVGDKLTLIVVPLLVAAGATVVKLSGRGLGHTGGTVDKLESIPGYRAVLASQELLLVARRAGGCMAAQTASLVPADGVLYALRDATATTDSLPLIASSIVSKKLASGAETIVFDVKSGGGALLPRPEDATALAEMLVRLTTRAGRRAVAVLTAMDEPLGLAVGNWLEVEEALAVLGGRGPKEVRDLSAVLAGEALGAVGLAAGPIEGQQAALRLLDSGAGLETLLRLVEAQGGDAAALARGEGPGLALLRAPVQAGRAGTLRATDALAVGRAAALLGAGRSRRGEAVDPGAGVVLQVRPGDEVEAGQPLAVAYSSDMEKLRAGVEALHQAFLWHEPGAGPVPGPGAGLVRGVIRGGAA